MKTKFLALVALVAIVALSSLSSSAYAQNALTASQSFTVIVPSQISITAPAAVTITHDETNNNQTFPAQQWVVKGNTTRGVNVSFATTQPFTNTTDSTQRDAILGLAVANSSGPATWTVTKATDTTNFASSYNNATVQATSNGVGLATFNLSVAFVTNTFGTFSAGNYVTTVTGTVAGN